MQGRLAEATPRRKKKGADCRLLTKKVAVVVVVGVICSQQQVRLDECLLWLWWLWRRGVRSREDPYRREMTGDDIMYKE